MSSQVELFFARSRASAQAPRRFFLEREQNRSLNDPCRTSRCTHRRGGERGGSISLDPNNNRSWNGLHLDSLAETANNRKKRSDFKLSRKIFISRLCCDSSFTRNLFSRMDKRFDSN